MAAAPRISETTVRRAEPPALDTRVVEGLSEEEVAQLLVARLRAFTQRGLAWHQALLRAVRPDR